MDVYSTPRAVFSTVVGRTVKHKIFSRSATTKTLPLSQKYSNSPTIEIFQDIILAWVQTGTTESLVRAEFWAMKALASPDLNNGRTFEDIVLPILLGWAQIDEACRLVRFEDWTKKLEEISVAKEEKGLDNIKPSDKIIGAAIMSWRNHQKWFL